MAAPAAPGRSGRGFQRWYGFHGGETHQFVPSLYHDNHSVLPPRTDRRRVPPDRRPRRPRDRVPRRPPRRRRRAAVLLLPRDRCVPLAAPRAAGVDRRATSGHFDDGLGRVARGDLRPPARERPAARRHASSHRGRRGCPRGTTSTPEDQAVAARFMECFAAYLSYTDAQIGRVSRFLEESGELDDTLIMLLSDNGASAEGGARGSINDVRLWNGAATGRRELRARIDELGGPTAHNNYPWGWTMAGNTPFKRWKREVHEGGVADPCIVRLPARAHGTRARGDGPPPVRARDRRPARPCSSSSASTRPSTIDGVAQTPRRRHELRVRARATRDAPERHDTQYFEMLGSRAIYHDGWKAVTFKPLGNMYDDGLDPDAPFDDDVWELYHVADDFSECHDLAGAGTGAPRRDGRALVGRGAPQRRAAARQPAARRAPEPAASPARRRDRVRVPPDGAPVPETVAVHVPQPRARRSRADVEVADGARRRGRPARDGLGARRLLALPARRPPALRAQPLRQGARTSSAPTTSIAPGAHELGFEFTQDHGLRRAPAGCSSTARTVGEGEIPHVHADAVLDHRRRAHVRLRGRARRSATTTPRRSGATRRSGVSSSRSRASTNATRWRCSRRSCRDARLRSRRRGDMLLRRRRAAQ